MWTMIFLPALVLGFLGSFHCVGMCGPLALSLPVQHLSGLRRIFGILAYNLGRVFTYSVFGLVFGYVGKSIAFFGTQQFVSILAGSLLLLGVALSFGKKRLLPAGKGLPFWNRWVTKKMLPFFHKRNPFFLMLIGLLNGLLPCGLVYMAIAGAVAFASPLESIVFMASFGLGTLPAMLAVSFAAAMIGLRLRNQVRRWTPAIMGIMGLLFLLRGLNLNIPYLSPSVQEDKIECCSHPSTAGSHGSGSSQ